MRGVCKEGRRKSERGGGRELASFKGRCAVGKKIRASVRERGRATRQEQEDVLCRSLS